MRLSQSEKNALFRAIKGIEDVYLFGSRVDDAKKGGDIDILVFSEKPSFMLSRNVSRDFFMSCEEKIDVIVMNPKQLTIEQQAFLNSIKLVKLQ